MKPFEEIYPHHLLGITANRNLKSALEMLERSLKKLMENDMREYDVDTIEAAINGVLRVERGLRTVLEDLDVDTIEAAINGVLRVERGLKTVLEDLKNED